MRFIRENLFLICTAGVVVVLGSILLAMSFSLGGDVDKDLLLRSRLSKTLSKFTRQPVNATIVKAQQERVEAVLSTQKEIVENCINWNKRNYNPFKLTFNSDQGVREEPAFPVNNNLYQRYSLTFIAAQTYRKQLMKLLEPLAGVAEPTTTELEEETILWEKKLQDDWEKEQRRLEDERAEGETEGDKPKQTAARVNFREMVMPGQPGAGRATAAGGRGVAPTVRQASEKALQSLLVRKAGQAMIYVSGESLDILLPGPELEEPHVNQIWRAQLNYWVTKDILATIKATNDTSARLAKTTGEKSSVLNSAVKELVKIDISEEYFAGDSTDGTRSAGGAFDPMMEYAPRGPQPPTRRTGRTSRRGSSTPEPKTADTLTGRVTCPQYSVIHYKFTVIMPVRYLGALEQNLLKQNYHTVMEIQIQKVDPVPENRYYGTDPVMQVTIHGELLLLSAWLGEMRETASVTE